MVRLLKRRHNIGLPTGDRQALSNEPISRTRTRQFGLRCPQNGFVLQNEPNAKKARPTTPSLSRATRSTRISSPKNWLRFAKNTFFCAALPPCTCARPLLCSDGALSPCFGAPLPAAPRSTQRPLRIPSQRDQPIAERFKMQIEKSTSAIFLDRAGLPRIRFGRSPHGA